MIFEGYASPDVVLQDGKKVSSWQEIVLTDWTQLLPNGLRGVDITGAASTEPALFVLNSVNGASEFGTVSSLATMRYVRETPAILPNASSLPAYDRFAAATLSKLSFKFAILPNVSFAKELTDGATVPGAPLTAEMPADFKQKVEAEVAELRETFKDMVNNHGNGRTPPPLVVNGR
jgi:hypothetical protein